MNTIEKSGKVKMKLIRELDFKKYHIIVFHDNVHITVSERVFSRLEIGQFYVQDLWG